MSTVGSSSSKAKADEATSPELARLKRGEWTLEAYLDDRVGRALAKLPPWLTDEQRETVRDTLRFQLATDPGLEQVLLALKGDAQPSMAR